VFLFEWGAGVDPLRGGEAPIPLVQNLLVIAITSRLTRYFDYLRTYAINRFGRALVTAKTIRFN
jgi:hypothetical protein